MVISRSAPQEERAKRQRDIDQDAGYSDESVRPAV